MGRSVSYPTGSVVAFRLLDDGEEDDVDWAYECLVDEVIDTTKATFPSFERFEGWRGREDRILLRNAFADCGISTYCGLARSGSSSVTIPDTGRPISTTLERRGHGTGLARSRDGSSTCLVSCAWSELY